MDDDGEPKVEEGTILESMKHFLFFVLNELYLK